MRRTGCYGFCERGPVVVIQPPNVCYLGADSRETVPAIVEKTAPGMRSSIVFSTSRTKAASASPHLEEIPFYKHQKRMLLENNALIDPTKIDDYIAHRRLLRPGQGALRDDARSRCSTR